ncbi:MAG: GEVED domain-containing protein [Caldilineaceae bacterium]
MPANADTTQLLGARFRLSTDTNLGPDGPASDGEVEDYLIAVAPKVSLGNRLCVRHHQRWQRHRR